MSETERLLNGNRRYMAAHRAGLGARPSRALAVLTCMDTRVDPLRVLGLDVGEAHILRNAGGRVTDDVLRSLAVSVHILGIREVVVMHHTGCGLVGTTDEKLQRRTGARFPFLPIGDHQVALREDLEKLETAGYLSSVRSMVGFLFDIDTGTVSVVVRSDRSSP